MTQKADHNDDEHDNLAWLDLETTGLSASTCAILEIGIIITTKDLEPVASKSGVVRPSRNVPINTIDPFVFNMHTKSGLWTECFQSNTWTLDAALRVFERFMLDYRAVGSPMCGNTINFDRAFAKSQMSELNRLFHYRNIDVSTLKNVFKMHFPDVAPFEKPTDLPHRVLGDLELTIAEYRYYLDRMRAGVTAR